MTRISRIALLLAVLVAPAFYGCSSEEGAAPAPAAGGATTPNPPGGPADAKPAEAPKK